MGGDKLAVRITIEADSITPTVAPASGEHALGMQVVCEQRPQEAVHTLERERLLGRHGPAPRIRSRRLGIVSWPGLQARPAARQTSGKPASVLSRIQYGSFNSPSLYVTEAE